MVSLDEIDQRIDTVDKPRSDRRKEAARAVGALAEQRATIVARLAEIDRELGEVLAAAEPDIGVDELAAIVGLKAADLTDWLAAGRAAGRVTGRRPARGGTQRQKATTSTASDGRRDPHRAATDTAPPVTHGAPGSPQEPSATVTADRTGPDSPGFDSAELDSARQDSAGAVSRPSTDTQDRVARVG